MPIGPTFGGLWEDSAEGMWSAWHSVWHSHEQQMLDNENWIPSGGSITLSVTLILRTEMQTRLWLKQAVKAEPKKWLQNGLTPGVTVRSVLPMTLFLRREPSMTEVLGVTWYMGAQHKI